MNKIIYRMSKEMFLRLKFPTRNLRGKQEKTDKPLSMKEILKEVNSSFGLKGEVIRIEII